MRTGASTIYPPPTRPGTPFLIFCLYTFVLIGRPQDFIPLLAPLRLALVFTVLISFVTLMQKREGISNFFWQKESKLYFLFFGIMCAGIPFSVYRRGSFNFVILGYVVNMVFYTLFLLHVNTLREIQAFRRSSHVRRIVLQYFWIKSRIFSRKSLHNREATCLTQMTWLTLEFLFSLQYERPSGNLPFS